MHGFQLWANLPSQLKMTAPRYQDIAAADIPTSWTTTERACA
jgi:redox-sensitive bicupin YhaK (pirin superfamily)